MGDDNVKESYQEQLPTAEQLDQQYTNICAQLGVLDYEYRTCSSQHANIWARMEAIVAEKEELSGVIDKLKATKGILVARQEAEKVKEESKDDDEVEGSDS